MYDLGKENGRAKPVLELNDGNRAINTLGFSPYAGHVLFSGSGDGSIKGWDMRINTKRPSLVLPKSGDSARELQCSPFNAKKLAVIYDSGVIQRWDIRNTKKFDRRMHAHSGVGLSLDWHPEYDYIASGGRDQQVQIWNMSTESRHPDHTIFTPCAVSRVRWQVDNATNSRSAANGVLNTNIASCGRGKGDYSTYIWNPCRPYIPVNVLESHKDTVSEICWRSDKLFWSASRDGYFYQYDLGNEPLLIDNLSANAFAWTPTNELSFVVQDKYRDQFGSMSHVKMSDEDYGMSDDSSTHNNAAVTNLNTISNSKRSASDNRRTGSSTYKPLIQEVEFNQAICEAAFAGLGLDLFEYFAGRYTVFSSKGEPLEALCEKNSQVAAEAGRYRTAQVWKVIESSIIQEKSRFVDYKAKLEAFKHVKPSTSSAGHALISPNGMISRTASSSGLQKHNQLHGPITSKIAESLKMNTSSANSTPTITKDPTSSPFTKTATTAGTPSYFAMGEPTSNGSKLKSETNANDSDSVSSATVPPVPVPENSGIHRTSKDDDVDPETSSYDTSGSSVGAAPFGSFDDKKPRANSNYTQLPMVEPKSYSTNDSGLTDENGVAMSWTRIAANSHGTKKDDLAVISDHSVSESNDDFYRKKRKESFGLGILNPEEPPIEEEDEDEAAKEEEKTQKPSAEEREHALYREFLDTLTQPWRTEKLIQRATEFALEEGDVQFCAVMGTMFLDTYCKAFTSPTAVEEWVHCYIQLLKRCGLFTAAAEVSKVSEFDSIKELSLTETTLETLCHRCMGPLSGDDPAKTDGFWYCTNCRKLLDGCSLCSEPVKGLALWVLQCGHKIHVTCMKLWVFEEGMLECPSGCGTFVVKDV